MRKMRMTRKQFDEAKRPLLPTVARLTVADRHTFAIGIDPGEFTGLAVFHRIEKRLVDVQTLDFWRTYWHIVNNYAQGDCVIYVEFTKHLKIHRRHMYAARAVGQRTAEKLGEQAGIRAERGTISKITRDAGGVIRESQLLMEGLRLAGYTVKEGGVADKDTWTQTFFTMVTKYQESVTQHARDAASLCWMR